MIQSSKIHLAEVNESYFEHQSVALRYSWNCFRAAVMAFIHGVIPGYFQTSSSDLVKRLAGDRKAGD
jgi:hypothetical protein